MRRGIAGYIPLLLMCIIVAAFLAIVAEERMHLAREAMQIQRMIEESSMSINASLENGVLEIRGEPGQSMDLLYIVPLHTCGHHMCLGHIHRVFKRIDPGTVFRIRVGKPSAVCFITKDLDLVCVKSSSRNANARTYLEKLENSIEKISKEIVVMNREIEEIAKNVSELKQQILKTIQDVSLANMMLALITRTDPDLYYDIASRYVVLSFEKVVIDPKYTKILVFASAGVYKVRSKDWYTEAWTRYRMFVALPGARPLTVIDMYSILDDPTRAIKHMKILAQLSGDAVLDVGKCNSLMFKNSSGGSLVIYRGHHFKIVISVSETIGLGSFSSYATPGGSLVIPTEVSYKLKIVPDPGYYIAIFIPSTELTKLRASRFGLYATESLRCFSFTSCINPYGTLINYNVFQVKTLSMKSVGNYMYVVTDRPITLLYVHYRNGGFYTIDAGPYHWPVEKGAYGAYDYVINAPGTSVTLYVFTLQER